MAFTVSNNLNTIVDCDSGTNWANLTAGSNPDTDIFYETTGSVGRDVDIETGYIDYDVYTANGNVAQDYSSTTIYYWQLCFTASFLDTWQNGGIRVKLTDGSSNESVWFLGGEDTYKGGWVRLCFSTSTTPDENNGTSATLTDIRTISFGWKSLSKSKLSANCFIDYVQEQADGTAMVQMTSGTGGFEEILDQEPTNYAGYIRKDGTVYYINGPADWGDGASTGSFDFDDTNQVVMFENRYRTFTTSLRTSAESLVSANHYAQTVQEGASATTDITMGTKSGSSGIQGCVLKSEDTSVKFQFDVSADPTVFQWYGCSLLDAGTITLPVEDATTPANREVVSCIFDSCAEVLADTCYVTSCNFVNADDRGVRMSTTSHNISSCNFIACGHGVHISATGTYDFDDLVFAGSNGSTLYDVENSTTGSVTINANGTTNVNASYVDDTGVGASTTIVATVTVDVHAEDTAGTNIQGAQVYVQRSTPTAHTAGAGNTAGNGSLVLTGSIDADQPQTGYVQVRDVSLNAVQGYRYASWTGSTFTFPTTVSFNCTGGGTSTSLQDTVNDFTAINIQEGDTIRNTTDGSWAVVDEIVDANNITTSELQGGSDNTWTSGDTYSVHDLATTLVSGVDTVDIPLANLQTDANGDIATFSYDKSQAPTAITIRVRSSNGTPKYVPFRTSGTITTSGFSVNCVLTTDTEAS